MVSPCQYILFCLMLLHAAIVQTGVSLFDKRCCSLHLLQAMLKLHAHPMKLAPCMPSSQSCAESHAICYIAITSVRCPVGDHTESKTSGRQVSPRKLPPAAPPQQQQACVADQFSPIHTRWIAHSQRVSVRR